jgi:hypothetical protein
VDVGNVADILEVHCFHFQNQGMHGGWVSVCVCVCARLCMYACMHAWSCSNILSHLRFTLHFDKTHWFCFLLIQFDVSHVTARRLYFNLWIGLQLDIHSVWQENFLLVQLNKIYVLQGTHSQTLHHKPRILSTGYKAV